MPAPVARPTGRRYRARSIFAADDCIATPLDRNERARLMALAEAIEARTRQRGRQNGSISRIGVQLLRAMLFKFLGRDGRLFPSYDALMRATGLTRKSVANAIARLERVGIVRVVRRIVRRHITRRSPITGEREVIVTTCQTSNAYGLTNPTGGAALCAPPATLRSRVPARKQGILLDLLRALEPSHRDTRERQNRKIPQASSGR